MSLRVTTNVLVNQSIRDINANLRRLQTLQKQISSGKRILKPSDDPIDTSRAMRFTGDLEKISYFQTNIRDGVSRLRSAERILDGILEIVMEVEAVANEGLLVTSSLEASTLSSTLDIYLQQMMQNANAKFLGKFIFGGTETLSGTAPLSAPFNPVYDADGNITGVIQNVRGISELIDYEIAEGQYTSVNISGDAPFQPNGEGASGDIFQAVIDLRDAFNNHDTAAATQALAEVRDAFDNVAFQASIVGTRISSLDTAGIQHASTSIDLKESLSATVDVDLARAIIEESYQSFLYQSSLQVGSRIIPQSLLDFI